MPIIFLAGFSEVIQFQSLEFRNSWNCIPFLLSRLSGFLPAGGAWLGLFPGFGFRFLGFGGFYDHEDLRFQEMFPLHEITFELLCLNWDFRGTTEDEKEILGKMSYGELGGGGFLWRLGLLAIQHH